MRLSVFPVVMLCDSVILSHVDFLVLSLGAHDVFAVYACAHRVIVISCYDLCLYVAFGSRTGIGPFCDLVDRFFNQIGEFLVRNFDRDAKF